MTSVGVAGRLRTAPDGLAPFAAGRDLRAVIELLERGFGDELEARDRRWLADLNTLSGAGPLLHWLPRLFPPAEPAFRGFVWYAGGRLVGNASVMRSHDDLWVIANVVTDPEHRRRGIAGRLMAAAIEAAHAGGARQIQLQVRSDNAAAQTMYRRLGFWHMNAAMLLRLPNPPAAKRLGEPPLGWSLVRAGRTTRARARRLLGRAGALDRGGPTSIAVQAADGVGLWNRLEDWLQGRARHAWAASADGELRGLVAVHAARWRGPHRLDLVADPAWAGRVEPALAEMALATLRGYPPYEVDAEIDADAATAIGTLLRAGFTRVRTLDRLALDLDGVG